MKRIAAIFLAIAITIIGLTACNSEPRDEQELTNIRQEENSDTLTEPEVTSEPVWQWQKDTPENHNMDSQFLNDFHNDLDETQVYTSLIIKDDVIIDEYYKDGYDQDSVFTLQSCSKSITSTLIGIAIDQGFIDGTDVPISQYFPQIEQYSNENLKNITIWHLLTHTSGLDISDNAIWDNWRASDDWVEYALSRPSVSAPGEVFDYSTAGTHLLTAILEKATGMSAYDFGKKYLFDPMGMTSVKCETAPEGTSDGGNGFAMNIYDMAKIGKLYLDAGKWQGRQLVSAQWIQEATSLQYKRSTGSADYGYQWWVRTFGDKNYDAFFAQGHAGQYIFVVPEINLIVVFTSNHQGSSSMYWRFVNDIVNHCD